MKSRVKKRILCFIVALVYAFVPTLANAVSENNLTKYAENNILYYDPDEEECTTENSSILIIGDSITTLVEDKLSGYGTIIAKWGKPWTYALSGSTWEGDEPSSEEDSGLGIARSNLSGHNVLVWLLGSNNRSAATNYYRDLIQSDIDDLYKITGDETVVLLMNNYDTDSSIYSTNNSLISSAVEAHENWHLIDWAGKADPSMIEIDDSYHFNVHPNDTGKQVFADLVIEAIEEYAGEGITTCHNKSSNKDCNDDAAGQSFAGGDMETKLWNGLRSVVGLTEEQAAGAMGNMQSESKFNVVAHEESFIDDFEKGFKLDDNPKTSYGIGLIQWSFNRRIGIYNRIKDADSSLITDYLEKPTEYSKGYQTGQEFLDKVGDSVVDKFLSIELDYLKYELDSVSSYNGFLQTKTVDEAAEFFLKKIEVCNSEKCAPSTRKKQAQDIYKRQTGHDPEGTVTEASGSSNTCPKGDVAKLQSLVKAWAWENYRGDARYYDPLQQKPAYTDVISRTKYSGACKGNDCGAFVYNLMVESGWDPSYPATGVQGQLEYLSKSPDKWKEVGRTKTFSSYEPGDVIINYIPGETHHVLIYAGKIPGFSSGFISASQCDRAPMASSSDKPPTKDFHVYRKIF